MLSRVTREMPEPPNRIVDDASMKAVTNTEPQKWHVLRCLLADLILTHQLKKLKNLCAAN